MRKILIFGNSGSGKSTLAKQLSTDEGLAHLDLDTIAWLPSIPPERESLSVSKGKIVQFVQENDKWVIEGCYSDLLKLASPFANEMIFLNLSVEKCIEHCRYRPWEPHKYKSKQEQDKNLEMLIDWIRKYPVRTDEFSLLAHQKLFDEFKGKKTIRS